MCREWAPQHPPIAASAGAGGKGEGSGHRCPNIGPWSRSAIAGFSSGVVAPRWVALAAGGGRELSDHRPRRMLRLGDDETDVRVILELELDEPGTNAVGRALDSDAAGAAA